MQIICCCMSLVIQFSRWRKPHKCWNCVYNWPCLWAHSLRTPARARTGCDHDKGSWKNMEETCGSLSGWLLYPFPLPAIKCAGRERQSRRELLELYSHHKRALPYFEKMYVLRAKRDKPHKQRMEMTLPY